jgi:hypothetical protein
MYTQPEYIFVTCRVSSHFRVTLRCVRKDNLTPRTLKTELGSVARICEWIVTYLSLYVSHV